MNQNADELIYNLTPAINEKCDEIIRKRKAALQFRIFMFLCIMTVTIPALLVFAGISLTFIIVPIVFMSLCIVLLLPVLLSNHDKEHGGNLYEQI